MKDYTYIELSLFSVGTHWNGIPKLKTKIVSKIFRKTAFLLLYGRSTLMCMKICDTYVKFTIRMK